MAQFIPASFPQFGLLPPELRSLVWEATFPGQRLLEIPRKIIGYMPQLRIPAIVHACRESRYEYLTKEGKNVVRIRRGEWFNLKNDTVSIPVGWDGWEWIDEELKPHIRSIFLIGCPGPMTFSGYSGLGACLLGLFRLTVRGETALNTINIVPCGDDSSHRHCHSIHINDRAANLFGNNTLLSANIQNKSECDSMIASFSAFQGANQYAMNLLKAYKIGIERELQDWTVHGAKRLWIGEWHRWHRLPIPPYYQRGRSEEDTIALFENDPAYRDMFDKMPKINIVLLVKLEQYN
ncbi:hypothetical protein F5Y00DRAFT_260035 [Daldinia vernicosa]|uniref:uncharacterized protein n=1 Tax=Daldinia vernicosa TaxID=114800 RepID=UPI0020078253|nr:uncharacterized protein F5Y00DRAFT_260035 [Daldinia vernicosa]KAI0851015.1 hypothetical protein F5Y00DRAFT_260035 [Daldinia vernicosa]